MEDLVELYATISRAADEKSPEKGRTEKSYPRTRMRLAGVRGECERSAQGLGFVEMRRCRFHRAGLEDFPEIYATISRAEDEKSPEKGRKEKSYPRTRMRLAGVRGECERSAQGRGLSKCADAAFRRRDWKVSSRSMRQPSLLAAEKGADVFSLW